MQGAYSRALARSVFLALAAAQGLLFAPTALARERLRIRGAAEFANVAVVRGPSSIDVSGILRDDAGAGVAGRPVSIDLPGAPEPPRPCPTPTRPGDVPTRALETDGTGSFCLRLATDAPLGRAILRFDGDPFLEPATAPLPPESGPGRLVLEFEAQELVAPLDAASWIVWVKTRAADGARLGEPLRLVLLHRPEVDGPDETEVGATDVVVGSTAKFDVDTRALGAPGVGKMIVRFGGSSSLSAAHHWALVSRRATVRLALAARLAPSDPASGAELPVAVSSSLGAVPDGWVEALAGEGRQSVGLGGVRAGAARVVATFSPPRGRPAIVTLRYLPASAGWVPEGPIVVEVPVVAPSPWRGAPWLLAALAVAYGVVRAWRRPARAARPKTRPADSAVGRAVVELLEADGTRSGWRGRVIDAHEGTPISGARVNLFVPVFDGEGVAATVVTPKDGSFALAPVEAARSTGARLVVQAAHHATLSEPMPPDGVLAVCLVSRRRALLDRLVRWADRAGRPWSRRRDRGRDRDPTPLELAEIARRERQVGVAAWAVAVAEAAYGPVPPDELRDADIRAREPGAPDREPGEGKGKAR